MTQFERYRWQDHVVPRRSWRGDLTFLALILSLLAAASMLERPVSTAGAAGDGAHPRARVEVSVPALDNGPPELIRITHLPARPEPSSEAAVRLLALFAIRPG
jgi:hypothetical protein